MAKHLIKTEREIGEEIRRRAQGAADATGHQISIQAPSVTRIDEATLYGSHWILETAEGPGTALVEKAAIQIAKIWDIAS